MLHWLQNFCFLKWPECSNYRFSKCTLLSQRPHLPCTLSCQGTAICLSNFIVPSFIRFIFSLSLCTSVATNPCFDFAHQINWGTCSATAPAKRKSGLASLVNWKRWPLLWLERLWNPETVFFVLVDRWARQNSAGNYFSSERPPHFSTYALVIAARNGKCNSHLISWKIKQDEELLV